MASLLREAGLDGDVELDSAGTGGWHAGAPPDERATAAAARRGIVLEGAARQVRPSDFDDFDLLVAMDRENRADLLAIAPDAARAHEGAPAARVRPGVGGGRRRRRARPLLRRPRRLRARARRRRGRVPRAARRRARVGVSRLAAAVGAALGREVTAARRVGGGSINDAYAMDLGGGGRAFVKTRATAAAGEFAGEAAGLRWLAEPGAVAVPEVLGVGDGDDGAPRFLALEWIEAGALDAAGADALGRDLAALHAAGAPAFGGEDDMRIGDLVLPNEPLDAWPAFYAQRRLAPLAPRAGLSAEGRRAVDRVCERIDELAGPAEPPARLHGDLWGGNVMAAADGRAWLIDPAPYGGHREVDLAMLSLFGAPSERVFAAYAEAAPLADGHAERVAPVAAVPAARARGALRRRIRRAGRARGRAIRLSVILGAMDLGLDGQGVRGDRREPRHRARDRAPAVRRGRARPVRRPRRRGAGGGGRAAAAASTSRST